MSEPLPISAEASALLAVSRRVFLLTLRADGSPTAHPMTGVFASGRLAFSTYRKAAKTRNARQDPRTCSLALQGYEGAGARAVVELALWSLPLDDVFSFDFAKARAPDPAERA